MMKAMRRFFFVALISALFLIADLGKSTAGPILLVDVTDDLVLDGYSIDEAWYPASLTKLMTAYVVFEFLRDGRAREDEAIFMTASAAKEPPSKLGLPPGEAITLGDAVSAVLIRSANDVASALGQHLAGTEENFVALMNETALRLGMMNSRFANPSGLPGGEQRTTARDMAILAKALLKNFPEYRHLYRITGINYYKDKRLSHNALLENYPGTIGLKTGFICAAGYNQVAATVRDGRMLIAVVLGAENAKSRLEITASLLESGFRNETLQRLPRLPLGEIPSAGLRNQPANLRPKVCPESVSNQAQGAKKAAPKAPTVRFRLLDEKTRSLVLRMLALKPSILRKVNKPKESITIFNIGYFPALPAPRPEEQ